MTGGLGPQRLLAFALLATLLLPQGAKARADDLRVGPGRPYTGIAAAIRSAQPGSTILVDAGSYPGDVAVIDKDDLSLRAVGGAVRISAVGRAVEGKGIFVVRANGVLIEGFSFSGAKVPDRNGAGIRFDRGSLTVRDCVFRGNEAGLLAGNDPQSTLRVETSEFAENGVGDGQTHQLYAGTLKSLTVIASYFHHGIGGQLIKSRAEYSEILYNRLSDETGGRSSYELEFPNGGRALVMGNLIQQSATTENRIMISFGVEGYGWPVNELLLSANTLDDRRPANGVYLFVKPGATKVLAYNNLFMGGARSLHSAHFQGEANFHVMPDQFQAVAQQDYRLQPGSAVVGKALDGDRLPEPAMIPRYQYRHPRSIIALDRPPIQPGALQETAPRQF